MRPDKIAPSFAVSRTGLLLYRGVTGKEAYELQVFSKRGQLQSFRIPAGVTNNPKFSPDGTRILYDVETGPTRDLWLFDLDRKINTRFTLEHGYFSDPLWSLTANK